MASRSVTDLSWAGSGALTRAQSTAISVTRVMRSRGQSGIGKIARRRTKVRFAGAPGRCSRGGGGNPPEGYIEGGGRVGRLCPTPGPPAVLPIRPPPECLTPRAERQPAAQRTKDIGRDLRQG